MTMLSSIFTETCLVCCSFTLSFSRIKALLHGRISRKIRGEFLLNQCNDLLNSFNYQNDSIEIR